MQLPMSELDVEPSLFCKLKYLPYKQFHLNHNQNLNVNLLNQNVISIS